MKVHFCTRHLAGLALSCGMLLNTQTLAAPSRGWHAPPPPPPSQVRPANSCESLANHATIGIAQRGIYFMGGSGTIYAKQIQRDGSLNLIVFTDFHIANGLCEGEKDAASGCSIRVHFDFDGVCGERYLDLPMRLIRTDAASDTAIIGIDGISEKDFPNANSCITTLPVSRHLTVGNPVFRIGHSYYDGGARVIQRGTFLGYADANPAPWSVKPELPEGHACDQPSPYDGVSRMSIVVGQCGGPVVDAVNCELLALSQMGPYEGKSFDLPAQVFETLYLDNKKLLHCDAEKLIPHDPYAEVMKR